MNAPPREVVQGGPGGADKPMYPNIGLGYLLSILRKNKIKCMGIDAAFDGLNIAELRRKISDFQPDILGFTAMTHQITHTAKVAEELKNQFGEALFIIGGSHATVAPTKTLNQFPVFDIAVIGEGERTIIDIVKAKQTQVIDFSAIQGIAYRSGKTSK